MKNRKKNIIFSIAAFFIPIAVILISMIRRSAYPFGNDFTTLIGDSNDQYMQFFLMLYDRLEKGKSFLFSWDSGMGVDFFSNFCYYLANPCNWIVLLFGKTHIELGMICAILFQIGGCAVTAMYFFTHSKINRIEDEKWNLPVCLLFSAAYALCDYILAYRYNLMWLMGMMLIPLLMLSMEYLVDKKDGRLYGILLFIGFVSNFYYAWFLCIWAIVCFLEQEKKNFRQWKETFVRFVTISVLSALCAAAVLVPAYSMAFSRSNSDWYTVRDFGIGYHALPGNFLSGLFWAHKLLMVGTKVFTQNNYCGIFVLVLVITYFFNKNIEKKQRVKRFIEIAVFIAALNWIGLYWIFHGCTIPHMYTNRFAILFVFILLMTAFEALYKIQEIRLRNIGIVGLLLAGIFAVVIFNSDLSENVLCYLVTMFLMVYLVLCLGLLRKNSIRKTALIVNLCVLGFTELLTNLFFSNADSITYRTDAMQDKTAWIQNYNNLEVTDGERKTAFFLSDKHAFFYSQTNFFASAINSDLVKLFDDLGLASGVAGVSYLYEGTTPLTAVLFNVRYVLTDQPERFGGYSASGQADNLYEADALSGFGFMLPEAAVTWKLDENNMFEVQNNFTRDVLGTGELFTRVTFDDLQAGCDACELLSYTDEEYHYLNQDAAYTSYASILLSATIPEDMDLYFYSKGTNTQACSIYIDDKVFYDDDGTIGDDASAYHIGMVKQGQKIAVLISDLSEIQEEADIYAYFYQYHDDIMEASLEKMKGATYEIDVFEDTYLSGTVDAVNDGILYTSIPYYKGFTAYVDGKEAEIVKIGDAMMGVRVSAGAHKVEFHYVTYGLKTGLFLSAAGIILSVLYCIYMKKRRNFKDEQEEKSL